MRLGFISIVDEEASSSRKDINKKEKNFVLLFFIYDMKCAPTYRAVKR